MSRLLTKRKEAWVERRQPEMVAGTPLNAPAGVEARYAKALERAIRKMCEDVEKQLRRLMDAPAAEEFFAADESIASQGRIVTNALIEKYNGFFGDIANPLAESTVGQADAASTSAVHGSLKELSGGLSLRTSAITKEMREVLKASITENVGLIKSIPQKYLEGVQQAVMRSITSGNGMKDLVPYLDKHRGITIRRARFIAKDQTRKAFNNLNKGRMENLGLRKYKWLHTGGSQEPRPLHIAMSGNIYSFDDPPVIDKNTGERGIPGQLPGCRCRMVPVIEFED